MSLTLDDLKTVFALFRESGYGEMRLRIGALSLTARKEGLAPKATDGVATASAAPARTRSEEDDVDGGDAVAVRATISGTFYRAPSPGADAFCKVGDRVRPDTTLGLIEVMKLFTSVQAGIGGTVVRIVPENGALVEPGQPLVLIRQDEARS
jgi:acetyl-CoA carboxylase biotin carboxyl carrier protein